MSNRMLLVFKVLFTETELNNSRPEATARSGIFFHSGVIRHCLIGVCGVLFRSYPFPRSTVRP